MFSVADRQGKKRNANDCHQRYANEVFHGLSHIVGDAFLRLREEIKMGKGANEDFIGHISFEISHMSFEKWEDRNSPKRKMHAFHIGRKMTYEKCQMIYDQ